MIRFLIPLALVLFLNGCKNVHKFKSPAPSATVSQECKDILSSGVFVSNASDEIKEDCLLKNHIKLKSYNAYTFNSGVNQNFTIASGKSYYVLKKENALKVKYGAKDLITGGVIFKLNGDNHNTITMEAPLGGDIFADIAWNYNISTYITLTSETDNDPVKLIAYRNTTNNRVDLHHLDRLANKNFSDRYKIANLKVLFENQNIKVTEADLYKFNKKRKIRQIEYKTWIDDAAINVNKLKEAVDVVNRFYDPKSGTMSVNCFAGLHRTKTFILARKILNEFKNNNKKVNLEELIDDYNQKTLSSFVLKHGEQAPAWKNENSSQRKLIADFQNHIYSN